MHNKPVTFGAVVLFLSVVGLQAACSGRPHVEPPPDDLGVVAGRVFKGAVKEAAVTVYRLEGTSRGAVAGTATTDADGAFRAAVGTATGPFLVVATSGNFIDEATGVTVQLNSTELTALVPKFDVETKLETLRISPVSHLAAGLALFWAKAEGRALSDTDSEAWQRLNGHFGALDWRTGTPTDVTATMGATLDEATRQGLLLAAFSMEARLIAEAAGITPGGRVNALTLVDALHDDLTADGFFDGLGASGRLVLPFGSAVTDSGVSATQLDGQTIRTGFAQGIAKFLASDRNVTRVSLADVQSLISTIATNADARLFRDASGPADVEPPTIAFVKPAFDMAGVHGVVDIEVSAVDNTALKSFVFTAPSSLLATAAMAVDGKSSVLRTTVDVSSLMDGPLVLSVKAIDTSNNEVTKSITVVVSNRGPVITVASPGEGAAVTGLLAISATATAQAGAISKLELRMPPAGVGTDTLPAADAFGATWNTLGAPEGLVTLTFHAEDTLGGFADQTVSVNIDNVALGNVTATVSLGAPVGGLSVQMIAFDDDAGVPLLGRVGGAVLGETAAGVATDPMTGAVSFVLSQENYQGPVQLIARGAAATYVDPTSDLDAGATIISLPANFTLTTLVKRYRSGDAISVPITGWTTLADDAVIAYVPDAGSLSAAIDLVDPLFSKHITGSNSWPIRATFPVSLVTNSQSLRDVVYAALPDVALNQLARDTAIDVGLTPGTGYAAPQMLASLRQDISDGKFDGKAGSMQLFVGGMPPVPSYLFDANTTRFKQAISMDRFVRSVANRSGLARDDFQTQHLFDNITGDSSRLYPSTVGCDSQSPPPNCPIPFDNLAPTLSWNITFANGPLDAGTSPVDTARLVAGLVRVELTAGDPSGLQPFPTPTIQTLSFAASAGTLTPLPSNNAERFAATIDVSTLNNGPLTFTATACDRLANCGPTAQYATTVTVDKTSPSINIISPSPQLAFVSAAFDVHATATDGQSRIDSLAVTNPVGLRDLETASPDIFDATAASWTLTAPDGPFAVGFKSCDVVGNCSAASREVSVDKTPPLLTWVQQPPGYTTSLLVSFSVTATDGAGAGVRHVYAGVNGMNPVEGSVNGSTWSFANFDTTAAGSRNIVVWGEDGSIPANSGRGSSVPNAQLSFEVLIDQTRPALNPASYRSFKDEDGVSLVTGAGGIPVVPAQYDFGSAPNRTVDLTSTSFVIKKTTTLLSSSSNRPWLTWAIPYNAATDSPISSVTFTSNVNRCRVDTGNCLVSVGPSGSLVLDLNVPSPAANTQYYSYELNLTQPGSYTFTFTVTDAAGNTAQRSWSTQVQVFGAPLVIIPDTAWETSATDTNNALRLRIADKSYERLFGTGVTLVGNAGRVRRYLVYNAATEEVPVLFEGAPINSRTTSERWQNSLGNLWAAEGDGVFTADGLQLQRDMYYSSTANYCANTNRTVEPWPCPNTAQNFPYARHVRGTSARYECIGNVRTDNASNYGPLRYNNTVDSISVADDASIVGQYMSPAAPPSVGGETSFAANVGFGPTSSSASGAKVPAASTTAPGVLSFYIALPVQTHGAGVPLTTQGLPHRAGGADYQYYFADFWDVSQANPPSPGIGICNGAQQLRYGAFWWYRILQTSTTSISATFTAKSGGLIFSGGLFGTPWSGASTRTLSPVGSSPFNIVH